MLCTVCFSDLDMLAMRGWMIGSWWNFDEESIWWVMWC
jgi:hypothetical protein